jgi:hypothetical protein
MRSWTPDSRTLDFTVVDASGNVLCTMHGLEMRRLSIASRSITENRYDLIYQPVVNKISAPKLEPISPAADNDVEGLLKALDRLAVDIVAGSLKDEPTVGDEPSVQKYAQFAKDLLSKELAPLPSSEALEEYRAKYPVYFELTDRISAIQKRIFSSSSVSCWSLLFHINHSLFA